MAKEEAKGGGKEAAKPAGGDAPAGAPMFSKAGMMLFIGGCVVSAAIPTVYHLKSGGPVKAAPAGHEGEEASTHTEEPAEPSKEVEPGHMPKLGIMLVLEPIKFSYRDNPQGGTRRSNPSVTIALEIQASGKPGKKGEGGVEMAEEDKERKKAVEDLIPWIRNKIYEILRGRGPEDFATNEMIEQVQHQIQHAINDEKFGKKPMIQAVLFTEQSF